MMIEHPADLAFRVVDEALVQDVEDRAGLNRVEVPHQAKIIGVEAADRPEV